MGYEIQEAVISGMEAFKHLLPMPIDSAEEVVQAAERVMETCGPFLEWDTNDRGDGRPGHELYSFDWDPGSPANAETIGIFCEPKHAAFAAAAPVLIHRLLIALKSRMKEAGDAP